MEMSKNEVSKTEVSKVIRKPRVSRTIKKSPVKTAVSETTVPDFPLYDQLNSSINHDNIINVQVICATINKITDLKHIEVICALIIHHHLLTTGSVNETIYNTKPLSGKLGVLVACNNLPHELIKIIHQYLSLCGE